MDFAISALTSGHPVEPDQQEPGLSPEEQPAHHHLSMVLMAWDVRAVYGVVDRFGLGVRLPIRANVIDATFEDHSHQELGGHIDSIHHRDEVVAGLGDVVVDMRGGLVRPGELGNLSLDLRFGLSLPTGQVEDDPFELGRSGLDHQHIFFGSGTVMPQFGLSAHYTWPDVTLGGWLDARASIYEGPEGYKPASTVAAGLGVQSGFGLERWRFLLQQEVFFEEPAEWDGQRARNSGRTDLIATAGAFWHVADDWQLTLLVKVPYVTFTEEDQLDIPFLLAIGASWSADVGP